MLRADYEDNNINKVTARKHNRAYSRAREIIAGAGGMAMKNIIV